MHRNLALAVSAAALFSTPLAAQWGNWEADSLLAEGRLAAAESIYYASSSARPRDPASRAALGRFLAARGAPKVGLVLIDEARFFGGDSASLARSMAPLLVRLNDYRGLVELAPDVLGSAERRRATWLARNAPETVLRDSVAILTYKAVGDGTGLGTVSLKIGRSDVTALIDPRVNGMVVGAGLRPDLRTFGAAGDMTLAVAPSVRLGGITFTNVPVSIERGEGRVRIGFDLLAALQPSFDPAKGLITVRRIGRRSPRLQGSRIPALFDATGIRLLLGSNWQPTSNGTAALFLATRGWTWDSRMGDVVLATP